MSFELGLLETIGYFVICLSKKVLTFADIVLKPQNKVEEKIFLKANVKFTPAKSLKRTLSRKLIPAKSLLKLNSRNLIPAKSSVKPNSRKFPRNVRKKNSRKLIPAKISSL